jgi:DNA-directed RNA polymerase specialized sigma24 family protein
VSRTRGDRFEGLYRDHHPAVRAYLLRRAEPELAQKPLSETFLAAWRRLDELPGDPLPWLLATARRTLANHRHSARRLRGLRERMAGRETAEAADPAEQVADADRLLASHVRGPAAQRPKAPRPRPLRARVSAAGAHLRRLGGPMNELMDRLARATPHRPVSR